MRVLAVLGMLALAACQTRQANPVAAAQPSDAMLDCRAIQELQLLNRQEAARLAKLDEGVAMGNAFAIAISQAWIFWPAVMGVDMSDAEEIEARALRDRNRRLAEIARRQGCPETAESQTAPAVARS